MNTFWTVVITLLVVAQLAGMIWGWYMGRGMGLGPGKRIGMALFWPVWLLAMLGNVQ